MKAVVQRVTRAEVRRSADAAAVLGRIDRGLLVLLGIGQGDDETDAAWLIDKILNLRVFPPAAAPGGAAADTMDRSLLDIGGQLLVVSQFTLYGDCRKGRRPSFTAAMAPGAAKALYDRFLARLAATGVTWAAGEFGAMMHVELVNDGPVTLIIESAKQGGAPFIETPERSAGR